MCHLGNTRPEVAMKSQFSSIWTLSSGDFTHAWSMKFSNRGKDIWGKMERITCMEKDNFGWKKKMTFTKKSLGKKKR